MKKRFLAAVLALTMTAACLTACGDENNTEDKQQTTTTTTSKTTTTSGNAATVSSKKNTTAHEVIVPTGPGQTTSEGYWHTESTTTKATTTTTAKATTTKVNTTAKPKTTTTKATTSKKKNTDQKIAGYIRMGDKKQGIRNVKGVPAWKFESGFSSHGEVTTAQYTTKYYTCEVVLLYDGIAEWQLDDYDRDGGMRLNPQQYKGHTLNIFCGGALARFPNPVTYLVYHIKLGNGATIKVKITPGGEYAKKNCPKGQEPTTWARNNLDKFKSVFSQVYDGWTQYYFVIDALI